ncbi:hypothetical protein [Methyloprofundus sp.]|uniref:hypothetical protein n=1 Tax=Methyloprofundus sp. TaxID=2020875 RepID=UPI003D0B67E8
MYLKSKSAIRIFSVLASVLLFSGCGTVRLEVPEGHQVRILAQDESAEIRVERTVWFWLWGARPISDNTTKSDIEKYNLKEVRAYTTQTMTDNLLLIITSLVSIVRRTLIVEGNTDTVLPTSVIVTEEVKL